MRTGLKAPVVYHGPRERGKDIVCFDLDRLGRREYLAVVAKVTDLDGSVSSANSLLQVVHQVEQCFDVPYEDLFGMTRVTMDRVWVVTSGRIIPGAADSIYDQLQKRNLSKLVRFVPGENLVQLIDEHYSGYWEDSLEPVHVIREQNNRLAQFSKKLLLAIGGKDKDVDATVNAVINSPFLSEINVDRVRTLSRLSAYSVELESISSEYAAPVFTAGCGSVRKAFDDLKQNIYYAMFEIDDVIRHYEDVIKKTDPKELLGEFSDTLSHDYPFSHDRFGSAADARKSVEYLEWALEDIDELYRDLKELGKFDWAVGLVNSVAGLKDEIESFLTHLDKASFTLFWRIETVDGRGILRLLYEDDGNYSDITFSTSHVKETDVWFGKEQRKRRITLKDVTQEVQSKIRDHLDQMLLRAGIKKPLDPDEW
jgi:hypothetical protein